MKAVIRGAAVVAVMALALTGCKDGSTPAKATAATPPATTGGGSSAPADGEGVTPNLPPVWVDTTGLYAALPSDGSIGDVMVGGDPVVVQGEDAVKGCSELTTSPCAGIQAIGNRDMEARGSADEARVEFTLFTFATAEEASSTMKILAEHERKESAEHDEPAKPVTLDAGADETQAMQDGDSFEVVMRIGAVVAHLHAGDTELGNVEYAAKVQIARVTSVSNGINPDR
ncbi:hypothetical protein [Streptomyces sp. NRRL F-5727]|uniref:hypothetical protein n=1 Tax=Streptomyces sp. NRRL F-5727 TaxID=1463871 RepID=UPI0004C6DBE5|nr:hypothetical protein [Streptomyces sp. NRRL F-5727]